MAMFIRQAFQTDVPRVSELQRRMFEEGGVDGFAAETVEQLEKSINPYFLVAEVDGKIIGFISGDVSAGEGSAVVPEGEKYLEIETLYGAPESRNRGVGGALVDEMSTKARSDGATYATLYSATGDVHHILCFYERHNF